MGNKEMVMKGISFLIFMSKQSLKAYTNPFKEIVKCAILGGNSILALN